MFSKLLVRRLLLLAAPLLAVLSTACSDGALGDKGLVRFSFVGDFVESEDNTTPVATNTTLRIQLQHPRSDALADYDGDTFVQLHLNVEAVKDGDDAEVFPTGFSEYGVYFTKAGTYHLTAMQGETPLDGIDLVVEDADELTFADPSVMTDARCPEGKNAASEDVSLANLDLAENQRLTLFAVPRAKGKALLGLPALVADATNADVTTMASSYALPQLGLFVSPNAPGKNVELTATDLGNHLTARLTVKTHAGDATLRCE